MIRYIKDLFSSPDAHPMLKAFEEKKCVFIHIPKTAGVSISNALFGDIKWGHRTASFYIDYFGKKQFNSYYKFTVVRNPYDRLYSAYSFLMNGGINKQDSDFLNTYLKRYSSFEIFVRHGLNDSNITNWVHFLPQHHFLTDSNGELVIDYVAKMESIENDFITICNSLNIKANLKTMNKTKSKKDIVMSDEIKSIIKNHYKKDFTLFYPFVY